MPIIFDGRSFAQKKEELLKPKISKLTKKLGRKPKLVAVGVGSEEDIELYLRMKEKTAERLGVNFEKIIFDESENEDEICRRVQEKNTDKNIDGILLELPLPKKFDDAKIMEKVSASKDPDCMTYENLGRLLYGKPRVLPATVRAIKEILFSVIPSDPELVEGESRNLTQINPVKKDPSTSGRTVWYTPSVGMTNNNAKPLAYKNALVIGGSIELGKPLALVLSDLGAAISLCRSTTKNLTEFTKNADLIASAAGVPNLVKGDMVKEGVVVIDAGINLVKGKTQGDVEFETVSKKASFITPVPGGVGPVTIVSLFENLIDLLLLK